jgi:hypothetical protein
MAELEDMLNEGDDSLCPQLVSTTPEQDAAVEAALNDMSEDWFGTSTATNVGEILGYSTPSGDYDMKGVVTETETESSSESSSDSSSPKKKRKIRGKNFALMVKDHSESPTVVDDCEMGEESTSAAAASSKIKTPEFVLQADLDAESNASGVSDVSDDEEEGEKTPNPLNKHGLSVKKFGTGKGKKPVSKKTTTAQPTNETNGPK